MNAYIRIEHIDGERVCFLYDCGTGMVPLFQYAANRGMTICTLH